MAGIVSKHENSCNFHFHACLSNEQKQSIGGHLLSGIVEVTCEIVLLKTDLKVKRFMEETTGLMGLFLEPG